MVTTGYVSNEGVGSGDYGGGSVWILGVGYVDFGGGVCGLWGCRCEDYVCVCVCGCVCVCRDYGGIWVGVWGLWGEGVEIMGVGIRRCVDYMSSFVGGEVDVEVIRLIQATYSVVRFYMYAQSVWGEGEGGGHAGGGERRQERLLQTCTIF